jgi:hypothetical protein
MLADFPEIPTISIDFFRATTQADAYGEHVKVWSDVPNVTVDMKIRPLSGNSRFVTHMHGYEADYRGYCDDTPDIQQGDRAVDPDGNRYEVVFAASPMSMPDHMQVDMKRVSNDGNNGDTEGS